MEQRAFSLVFEIVNQEEIKLWYELESDDLMKTEQALTEEKTTDHFHEGTLLRCEVT